MTCGGCGNAQAWRTYSGSGWEVCDKCGDPGRIEMPDVYFTHTGQKFDNLAVDGQSVEFFSRAQKARFMKERGITEVGDKVHGAPFTAMEKPSKDRAAVRRQVREVWERAKAEVRKKYA